MPGFQNPWTGTGSDTTTGSSGFVNPWSTIPSSDENGGSAPFLTQSDLGGASPPNNTGGLFGFLKNAGTSVLDFFNKTGNATMNTYQNSVLPLVNKLPWELRGAPFTAPNLTDKPFENPLAAWSQGWNEDDKTAAQNARQVWDSTHTGGLDIPYLSGLGGFVQQAGTNVANAIPVGTIAKAAGIPSMAKFGLDWLRGAVKGGETAADAAKAAEPIAAGARPLSEAEAADINARAGLDNGYVPGNEPNFEMRGGPLMTTEQPAETFTKGPYAAYDWQSKISTPVANFLKDLAPNGVPIAKQLIDNPVTNGMKDILGKLFTKYYGTTPAVADTLRNMETAKNADLQKIMDTVSGLAEKHGLNQDEMNQVVSRFEGQPAASDKIEQAYKELNDLLHNGIDTGNGRELGTNHEMNTIFKDAPILDRSRLIDNYYPHRYNEQSSKEIEGLFKNMDNSRRQYFSTKGPFSNERYFATVDDAMKAGLKPEMNPYVAIAQRLAESSKSIRNAQALNDILGSGALTTEAKAGLRESSIPQLHGLYMSPEDHSALSSFIKPFGDSDHWANTLLRPYDKVTGALKNITTYNSLVHGHNIGYNGLYLGGAKPDYVAEAFQNIKNGNPDQWYDRAVRAGAISADRGKFLDNVKSAVSNSNPLSKGAAVANAAKYALHGALWDSDKALRTAIFREAAENGSSDAEAAARANKFLIDYNNTTPFEREFMSRIFPFYRWMKGNMPLQAEQWVNSTPKQALTQGLTNAASEQLSGKSSDDGKINTGNKLIDGTMDMIDPYVPSMEPMKLLNEGLIPFLYGRTQGPLKEGIDQFTNRAYYPTATVTPTGKENMANIPITKPNDSILQAAGERAAHAINNMLPTSGALGGAASAILGGSDSRSAINNLLGVNSKEKAPMTVTDVLTRLLGGFSSHTNPDQNHNAQPRYTNPFHHRKIG